MEDEDWDDSEQELLSCEQCGADVWGDAEQCPHCGWYFTDENSSTLTSGQTPTWIKVTALVMVLIFLLFAVLPLIQLYLPAPVAEP